MAISDLKFNKKYRITLEDQSSLERKINFSARLPVLWLLLIAITVLAGAFGMFILASTPMKNYLPGYLKESERTATEEQHMRLDSLVRVYEVNEAYISGILSALNPSEVSARDQMQKKNTHLSIDSLPEASEEERKFMENIRERDKYNIKYVSPAAAQTMNFGPISKGAIITEETKDQYPADIIVATGAPITSVAEGKVISVASSPKASGAYEVIIQHPKGFLSKTGRLMNLTVKPGDRLAAGQVIALSSARDGVKPNHISFELWHDGDPLIPADYISSAHDSSARFNSK